MSEEERVRATDDVLEEMEELRENHRYAAHNSSLASFHDISSFLDRWDEEVHLCPILLSLTNPLATSYRGCPTGLGMKSFTACRALTSASFPSRGRSRLAR